MQRLRSRENYGKTFRKTSSTPAFSWSRKIIDKYHVFMTLTVSNSVGKHVENEAFAHTGKLQKNFQENRLFIGIFLVQGNMWWTSCFSWVLPRVNGKFAIRFQISEHISMMSNFSVFHHFGKLTMNKGFCAVKWIWKRTSLKDRSLKVSFLQFSRLESVDDVWSSFLFPWQPYDSPKNCSPPLLPPPLNQAISNEWMNDP